MKTAGFVEYLRDNSTELLSSVHVPEWAVQKVSRYAKYVAYMRARPSKVQKDDPTRECAYRLAEQLYRLCVCTTAVLGKTEVDLDSIRITKQVALDTARGPVQLMADKMMSDPDKTYSRAGLGTLMKRDKEKGLTMAKFLQQIGVVKHVKNGQYVLTNTLKKIHQEVHAS